MKAGDFPDFTSSVYKSRWFSASLRSRRVMRESSEAASGSKLVFASSVPGLVCSKSGVGFTAVFGELESSRS